MNLIKKLTPISLALLIAGCAVGPDYEEPETTLAQTYLYAGNEESVNSEYWWKQFNDPTLNQMIVDVQQQNIPLQLAAERIKMANSYKKAVESFKVPTVSIGGGYYNYQLSSNSSLLGPALNPIDTSDGGTVTLLDNQHDGVFIGGSINWELDLFGRIDRQANAASIRAEQAEIFQVGLTTLITADLVHNYVQY
ncbi:TolC family protein, partial [Vibrio breoganii]